MFETLISAAELLKLTSDSSSRVVIVDCRFSLADSHAGEKAYAHAHIPNAVYAHLERDLSGPVTPGKTGRHPLPDPARLAQTFAAWGIDARAQVICYDDAGGAFAARLWWLLGWLGHSQVAVLDGGWSAWLDSGGKLRGQVEVEAEIELERGGSLPADFEGQPRASWVCSTAEVEAGIAIGSLHLLDARAPERYAGEVEPIDPVAGHLPTAQNLPFLENLRDGRFLPKEELRLRYEKALGREPEKSVMYCGSGVTACHNILAATHAGLPRPRLYAGSFSEWITDPKHAVVPGR